MKISTCYWIIGFHSINNCYNIYAAHEFFNFVWNVFNSKALKVFYIINFIFKAIQWVPIIFTHPGLLPMPYPLSSVNFFLNKHY